MVNVDQEAVPRGDRAPSEGRGARRAPSLERRLPLLVATLLLGVIIASVLVAYQEVRQAALVASRERLQVVARELAELLRTSFEQRGMVLRRVADAPEVRAALQSPTAEHLRAAAGVLARDLGAQRDAAVAAELWSVDGATPLVSLGDGARDSAEVRELLHALRRSGSVRASGLQSAGSANAFWVGVPVTQGRDVIGYFLQRRQLAGYGRMAEPAREIIGTDIRLYLANVGSETWFPFGDPPRRAPVVVYDDTVPVEYESADGGARLLAQHAIPGTPWLIVVESDLSRALSRPAMFLERTSGVFVLLIIGGALLAWLLGRHLARPLVALTNAAEAIAHGDYSRRVDAGGPAEIGRLGAMFNTMAARVQASNRSLLEAQERITRAAGRQRELHDVTVALSEAVTAQAAASVVIERGVAAAGASAGLIMLLSDDAESLEMLASSGYAPGTLAPWRRMSLEERLPLAAAVRAGEPIFLAADSALEARFPAARPLARRNDSRSWAAIPLVVEGRTLGVIGLSFAAEGELPEEERALLLALAHQCAQAIDRARSYESERAARAEAEVARAAAEAASRAKSEFLATMSHELRTPLNAIAGHAELLGLGVHGPLTEAQREAVQRIQRSQRHLLGLINDVLDFARSEAGQVGLHPAAVNLRDVLGALDALIAPQVSAKGLRYECTVADPRLAVRADPERLQQIVLNLLANAIKFTPRGGTIAVSGEACGDVVAIHVRDTGCGIPRERLAQIFAPFVQVDTGLTRVHDGVGLGLTISLDLARRMDGELTVDSELGRGSTFTVTLPRAEPGPAGVTAPGGGVVEQERGETLHPR